MPNEQAPLVRQLSAELDAVAAGVDATIPVGKAPFAGNVTLISYTPLSTITGANTNSRTLNLINTGQNGLGSTVVATLAFVSGVNATADQEKQLTLSGTPANVAVAQGDMLALQSLHVGTGLADPGGFVNIEITRTDPHV